MSKPRIGYLLQMFGIGGMPKWLYRLAGELQDEFEFHFIATHSSYVVPDYRDVASVAVLPPRKWPLGLYLIRKGIDIAQVANLRVYTDAALLARVPSVIERVDGLRNQAALASKKGLDLVIASSQGITKHLTSLIEPQKIRVIYNGVDVDAYDRVVPERFGFSDSDVIIGRTSRLAEGKNISLLIQAVTELRQQSGYEGVRLVVCGGDTTQPGAVPMLDRLKKEATPLGNSVVFTGELSDPKAVTKGYDIATCTSWHDNEGIPNSLLEAMAAAKPVVSSDVGDVREIVEPGKTGFLFPSKDLTALVEALRELVDDAKLRRTMGLNGKRVVETRFDLKQQAGHYRDLYWQLIEAHGRHLRHRLRRP